jgi:hypothetical protein
VVDANYHPAGFRSGSRMAMTGAPELIPAPTESPTAPADEGAIEPELDQPPEMGETETESVMLPRLRYMR